MSRKNDHKKRVVSAKQVAANQANATHSTGPRTERGKQVSSQNNFKHGFYAQLHPEVMTVLHEDPVEKVKILTGLMKSYPVENPAQQMVVDDIFDLRWQRLQTARSRSAKMALSVKAVERQRDRMHLQINHDVGDIPQSEMLEKGLRNIPDSPAKFGVLIDKLEALIQQADELDYSQALPYLTAIYGRQASPRGATIFNLFLDMGRLQRERAAALKARRPWPPPGDPMWEEWKDEATPQPGSQPGYDPRLDLPNQALLMYLNMELHDAQMMYSFFVEDKIMVTQINRDAALAPTLDSVAAARALWILDRDIDQKTRLLMKMLVEDRKLRLLRQQDQEAEQIQQAERAAAAQSERSGSSDGPQPDGVGPSGARPEANPGSDGARPPADRKPDQTREAPASTLLSTALIVTLVIHLVLSLTRGSVATPETRPSAARPYAVAGRESAARTPAPPATRTTTPHVEAGSSRHLPGLTRGSAVTPETRPSAAPPYAVAAGLPAGTRTLPVEAGSIPPSSSPDPRAGRNTGNQAERRSALPGRRPEFSGRDTAATGVRTRCFVFFRYEATDLLKTNDDAPGPNPFWKTVDGRW